MQASSQDPDIARANEAMLAGDLVGRTLLRSALRRRPKDFVALRMLGEIAGLGGLLTDGEALFRRALEQAPGFAYARLHLASALHDQERSGEAVAEIEKLTDDLLEFEGVKDLRADALGRVGEYEQAIGLYQEIVSS